MLINWKKNRLAVAKFIHGLVLRRIGEVKDLAALGRIFFFFFETGNVEKIKGIGKVKEKESKKRNMRKIIRN